MFKGLQRVWTEQRAQSIADLRRVHTGALPQVMIEVCCDSFQVFQEEHEYINLVQLRGHARVFCISDLDLCSTENCLLRTAF